MPGICTHEFFWPLKGADGNYYQVCRLCGLQCKYDWEGMQRTENERVTPESRAGQSGHSSVSRLSLLVELEPAHRVFLTNLRDTLRRKSVGAAGLKTVPLWREILFYSDIPWQRFAESMVCHMVGLAIVLVLSQVWTSDDMPLRRSMFENTHLTYYKPSDTFPALRGSPPRTHAALKRPAAAARQGAGAIRVAQEHAPGTINAPNIKLGGKSRPDLMASNPVIPEAPLASTRPSRLMVPAGPATLIAPPPEVYQATSRRLGMPQATGVAPAAEAGGVSSGRAIGAPSAVVIGPPPVLQASLRPAGDMNIGPSAVVASSPRLPVGEQRNLSEGTQALGSSLAMAVPPAPSAQGSETLANGRAGSLSGGVQVVPPPPSVQAAGSPAEGGRLGTLPGRGLQAVPPAPSMQAVQGAGNPGGEGRVGSPLNSGSNSGLQAVGPAPSLGAGGSGGRGGREVAMGTTPALGPASPAITDTATKQAAEKPSEPATEEMPLRLIGMAMALPTSSYFSNYEVFIAERKLSKGLAQFIKLVYVSLPYQRRLSEYGLDNNKVVKLRVSRDRSCDESLIQMTWPEGDPHPDVHNATDSPALSAADRKDMLPCYRTTADDYRKAIARR